MTIFNKRIFVLLVLACLLFLSYAETEAEKSKLNFKSKKQAKTTRTSKSNSKSKSKDNALKEKEQSKIKVKGAKDWKKVNLDKVDKDWEDGDEEVELENEYDRIKRIQQSKVPRVNLQDPNAMQNMAMKDPLAFSGGGGGSMVFVDLKLKMLSGANWNKNEVDKLAGKWAHLIRTGSVSATVYNIDERQILFNVERAWMTKDVMKFIALQPEVESFTLQNKKYIPADFSDEEDDL